MARASWMLLFALAALRALATLVPTPWTWGLDSLSDLPVGLRVACLALFAPTLVPAWMRAIESRIDARALWVASGVALILVATLPCGHALLGDSRTYLSSLERGVRAAGAAHREVLPQAATEGVYQLVGTTLGAGGTFRVVDFVLALVTIGAAVSLARTLGESESERFAMLAVILFGGGLLLFASYAEFYAFALAGGLLFARAGVAVLRRERPFWVAALAYAVAGLCHAQFIFAAPALFYLARRSWAHGRRGTWGPLLALPVFVLGALAALRYPFGELPAQLARGGAFLPPVSKVTNVTAYAVWSGWHVLDLLNATLLVAPAAAVFLPAVRSMPLENGRHHRPQERRFLLLLAAGPAVFAVIANPALGMVRDWDIFVLPVTLLAVHLATRGAGAIRGQGLLAAVVATSLLHAVLWLGLNHSADRSTERLRRVAAARQLFGAATHAELWRFLGSSDAESGRRDEAAKSFLRAIKSDPDDRMNYRLLATLCLSGGNRSVELGLDEYRRLLATVPYRAAYGYHGAALALVLAGRSDLALGAAGESVRLEPGHPELLAIYGDLLRREGRVDEARVAYDAAVAVDPWQPRACVGRACLQALSGDTQGAMEAVRSLLRHSPWSTQAQQFENLLETPGGTTTDVFRRYLYVR